jgi:hypothetical protein
VSGTDPTRRRFLLGGGLALSAVMERAARGRSPAPSPPSGPVPLPAPPRALVLPEKLRGRIARAEASGIAWAPALDRYLVVIDDTIDTDLDERRAPLVLALDRTGRFDEEPVPIAGITHLDDAESICAAGRERFFLMTSHAPNRQGRVRSSRRQLLELALDGRGLRVERRADLSEGKGGVPHLLRDAGADVDAAQGSFDAEAVTFHDQTLFIGLKAPLSRTEGRALVLKIEDLDGALRGGRLRKGHLRVWAELRLSVPGPDGRPVSEGISDMLFARDGALYLTANAPKGSAPDGGGALWRWEPPAAGSGAGAGAGAGAPELLQRFAGLKPEGLSPTPDGDALALVFDRGEATPFWTTWPLRAS